MKKGGIRSQREKNSAEQASQSGRQAPAQSLWRLFSTVVLMLISPGIFYYVYKTKYPNATLSGSPPPIESAFSPGFSSSSISDASTHPLDLPLASPVLPSSPPKEEASSLSLSLSGKEKEKEKEKERKSAPSALNPALKLQTELSSPSRLPVMGPLATNGAQPLYGIKHKGKDAIFALACNYPKTFYQRFVGSLRRTGYQDDIVLAVSPPSKMKPGVEEYVRQMKVVAYAFEVDCNKKDSCRFKDDFLGYPDPRPYRTFANMRYALYEYWLQYYSIKSYILILDFRDTFFQLPPFLAYGAFESRATTYDLQLYAENHKVKSIGKCVYNSLWIGRCFSKAALADLKQEAVICSGSTLGSFLGVSFYVRTMLLSMDRVQCWRKGIESDQGYQNYLFYKGFFHTALGNATLFQQGYGVVNTIGALNGKRVPKDQKGPLDTFWKIRDSEGYILNYNGERSAVVHQWDRFYSEINKWLDKTLFD